MLISVSCYFCMKKYCLNGDILLMRWNSYKIIEKVYNFLRLYSHKD